MHETSNFFGVTCSGQERGFAGEVEDTEDSFADASPDLARNSISGSSDEYADAAEQQTRSSMQLEVRLESSESLGWLSSGFVQCALSGVAVYDAISCHLLPGMPFHTDIRIC